MAAGLTWHFARPPVQGLDYEMDVARGRHRDRASAEGGNRMTIDSIGVVGAGTMGNGIAQAFAVAGTR